MVAAIYHYYTRDPNFALQNEIFMEVHIEIIWGESSFL